MSDDEFRLLMSVPNQDHLDYDHTSLRLKMFIAKFVALPQAIQKRLFNSVK